MIILFYQFYVIISLKLEWGSIDINQRALRGEWYFWRNHENEVVWRGIPSCGSLLRFWKKMLSWRTLGGKDLLVTFFLGFVDGSG